MQVTRRGHPGTEAYICSVIIAVVSLRSDAHSSGEKSRGSAEKDTGTKHSMRREQGRFVDLSVQDFGVRLKQSRALSMPAIRGSQPSKKPTPVTNAEASGRFRKVGVPHFGVLIIIRILLFRVLY